MPAIGLKQCDGGGNRGVGIIGGVAMPAIGLKQCDEPLKETKSASSSR